MPSTGTKTIRTDVAIIGGGMVGMTLACTLADVGFRVVVADRTDPGLARSAGFDGRVSAIAAGSARMLDAIGVWPRLIPDAQPILDIRITDADSPLFLHYDHRAVGGRPLGYIVENRDIRVALVEKAERSPDIRLLAPVAVQATTVSERPRCARVVLSDGRVVEAAVAVAADGKASPTRRGAGIETIEWAYPQSGIVCTVDHELPHRGVAHERFLPAGPFATLPMTGNRSSLVWTEDRDLAPRLLALDREEFLAELAWRFGDHLGALDVEGPRWSYPLAVTLAETYVGDRLALVGDAAHTIHPIAGQGFNLGLKDVAALAESMTDAARLGRDIASPDVLARYERWRRFDSTTMLAVTDGLNRLFSNDLAPLRLVRDVGLAAVDRLAPAKRFFMRHAMGLVGDLPRLFKGQPL